MTRLRTMGSGARRLATLLLLAGVASCSDFGPTSERGDGDDGGGDGGGSLGARIDELVPRRTVVGDTVRVRGEGFGATPDGATFTFVQPAPTDASGPVDRAAATAEVLSWSNEEIVVLVPAGALPGPTRLSRDGAFVTGPPFDVAPRRVTYSGDIVPILLQRGCMSCHGGEALLYVTPWSSLLAGTSLHGPVVVPRFSDRSLFVTRLRPETPPSLRMPFGGAYIAADSIQIFADWVDQGALDD